MERRWNDNSCNVVSWLDERCGRRHLEKCKNINVDQFGTDLAESDWSTVYSAGDGNDALQEWERILLQVVDKHIPTQMRARSYIPSWLDGGILLHMRDRDKANQAATQTPTVDNWSVYRQLRNKVLKMIKYQKANYYNSIINSALTTNTGSAWRTIKSVLHTTDRLEPSMIEHNGALISDSSKIADAFNHYFAEICSPNFSNPPPSCQEVRTEETLSDLAIDAVFLRREIRKLSISKAIGIDNIN